MFIFDFDLFTLFNFRKKRLISFSVEFCEMKVYSFTKNIINALYLTSLLFGISAGKRARLGTLRFGRFLYEIVSWWNNVIS